VKDFKDLIVFIGPPGAGKGSLSQLCTTQLGWMQLSTGFLCRKHIAEQTPIGKQIDFFIKSGKLVDDALIVQMVEQWLVDHASEYQGIILDGFPRTVTQAQALEALLNKEASFCRLNVVRLTACDSTIVERLATRFVCDNKDCQKVYSGAHTALQPQKIGKCDDCSSALVRRSDDHFDTIKERLKTYHGYERNLLEFYENNGHPVKEINVERPLFEVFEDFKKMIGCIA
jgi:adenylate kinase